MHILTVISGLLFALNVQLSTRENASQNFLAQNIAKAFCKHCVFLRRNLHFAIFGFTNLGLYDTIYISNLGIFGAAKHKGDSMRKWITGILIAIFSCTLLISAGVLGKYYWESYNEQGRFDELSQLKPSVSRPDPTEESSTEEAATHVEVTDPKTGQTRPILKEFAELYNINSDLVGWLEIPGTDINYPVLHAPDRDEYYLHRDFDGNYSNRGCLFVHESADVFAPSDNVTIYGHRMKDGTMFARLDNYMEKSFYEENPYIYFDTLSQLHTYQVIAVFLTTASVGEGFDYHNFVNAEDATEFYNFVNTCKTLALYDTDVSAEYGDKLICLSTCEYSQENGRLVVVAKRIQ